MLLLVKMRNAGELLWDSLDQQERQLLAYGVVYLATMLVTSLAKSLERRRRDEREQLKTEIREELAHGSSAA